MWVWGILNSLHTDVWFNTTKAESQTDLVEHKALYSFRQPIPHPVRAATPCVGGRCLRLPMVLHFMRSFWVPDQGLVPKYVSAVPFLPPIYYLISVSKWGSSQTIKNPQKHFLCTCSFLIGIWFIWGFLKSSHSGRTSLIKSKGFLMCYENKNGLIPVNMQCCSWKTYPSPPHIKDVNRHQTTEGITICFRTAGFLLA